MAALAWLLIPVIAAVASGLWGGWVGRRRTSTPDAAGVAGYERFRAAMERTSTGTTASAGATGAVGAAPDDAADRAATVAPREEAVPVGAVPARAGAVAHPAPVGPGRTGD